MVSILAFEYVYQTMKDKSIKDLTLTLMAFCLTGRAFFIILRRDPLTWEAGLAGRITIQISPYGGEHELSTP